MNLSRQRARKLARQSAADVARLLQVQEAQIASLQTELAATEAALTGVCELYFYDYVDPETGEVRKGWQ